MAVTTAASAPDVRQLALVGLLVVTGAGGTLGAMVAMPSTAVPVGASVIDGSSMEPTWVDGAVVIYVDANDIEVGDPVVFEGREGCWVAHRAIRHTQEGYVTQGDNVPYADQESYNYAVPERTLAGEVVLWVDSDGVHYRWP